MNKLYETIIMLSLTMPAVLGAGLKRAHEKRSTLEGINLGTGLALTISGINLHSGNTLTTGLNLPIESGFPSGVLTDSGLNLPGINLTLGNNRTADITLSSILSGLNIDSQVGLQLSQAAEPQKPILVPVDRPIYVVVPQQVPVTVDRPVAVTVNRAVAVPVDRPVAVPVDRPVAVAVPQPFAVPVSQQVPVPIASPVPVPVVNNVAVPVPYPVPIVKAVPISVGALPNGGLGSGIFLGSNIQTSLSAGTSLLSTKFGAYGR